MTGSILAEVHFNHNCLSRLIILLTLQLQISHYTPTRIPPVVQRLTIGTFNFSIFPSKIPPSLQLSFSRKLLTIVPLLITSLTKQYLLWQNHLLTTAPVFLLLLHQRMSVVLTPIPVRAHSIIAALTLSPAKQTSTLP